MKLTVDENITFAREAFSGFGELRLMNGRAISNSELSDTDILIVRSITQVNEDLLKNSKIKFVGTATIGTDHVDLNYLSRNNIVFADAKGCNADSVAEYVFTALLKVASEGKISLKGKTIGVVGIGNIGSRVVKLAYSLGMIVLKNDPPLERKGIGKNYVSLDKILEADIITFHVPLNLEGIDKTFHLINETNLEKIKPGTILINSSRGSVIDNRTVQNEMNRKNLRVILDVWEGEPSINIKLLENTKVGTSHIAGYSYEGKVNGTKMIYDSLCKFLNVEPIWQPNLPEIQNNELKIPDGDTDEEKLYRLFKSVYNLEMDDSLLRKISNYNSNEQCDYFDKLRKVYPVRREFSNYIVHLSDRDKQLTSVLETFRFQIKSIQY
jgi:erythronate-4-phosphate dehydrogenase